MLSDTFSALSLPGFLLEETTIPGSFFLASRYDIIGRTVGDLLETGRLQKIRPDTPPSVAVLELNFPEAALASSWLQV